MSLSFEKETIIHRVYRTRYEFCHYNYVIMNAMAFQITSRTIVYSVAYLGTDQSIHQSSASLAFVTGIHR